MAINLSVTARNGMLDALDTAIGTAGSMEILTGTKPATCATAESDTVLVTITLPNPALAAASSGAISKSGTWEDTSADGTGTAGYFRIYNSTVTKDQTTCVLQGTVTGTGGGGDLELDNTSISAGQTVTITSFTLTAGNA